MRRFFIFFLVIAGFTPVFAQQKYALVIGNAKYQRIGKLTNTINDAEDISKALRKLGYQVDMKLDVSRPEMINAIYSYTQRLAANPANEGFFWYAGHAVQINDENYLLPVDVNVDNKEQVISDSYSLNRLLSALAGASNRANVVILDACRDDPLPRQAGRSAGNRGLSVVNDVPGDLFVMFSTAPGDKADDGLGKQNSPFAEAFLKYIALSDPLVVVATDITQETMRLTGNRQRPFHRGSIISDRNYSLNPRGVPPSPGPTPAPVVSTGSVQVTSAIAGSVVIDGRDTGTRVKANGTAVISGVSTGDTEVAVKGDDGKVTRARESVVVRSGQTVSAVIERPAPADMVWINGGTFTMGSPASEKDRYDWEGPQHPVTISKGFYMGKYEVTQKEWAAVMGSNPSNWKGDNLPVEQVSWLDAIDYCNKRSAKEGLTPAYTVSGSSVTWNRNASGYRLPTEAEWEYACRAGTSTPFSTGSNITTNQANYNGNYPYNGNAKGTYRGQTWAVGSGTANAWGLYDMHGNVWEWCWDWYGGYASGTQADPTGASSGSDRVVRGGSWSDIAQDVRSAFRYWLDPALRYGSVGFRVLRP